MYRYPLMLRHGIQRIQCPILTRSPRLCVRAMSTGANTLNVRGPGADQLAAQGCGGACSRRVSALLALPVTLGSQRGHSTPSTFRLGKVKVRPELLWPAAIRVLRAREHSEPAPVPIGRTPRPPRRDTPKVDVSDLSTYMTALPYWQLSEDKTTIRRSFTARNFMAAIQFFNKVAEVAEAEGHHPDLHLTNFREVWTADNQKAGTRVDAGGLALSRSTARFGPSKRD